MYTDIYRYKPQKSESSKQRNRKLEKTDFGDILVTFC